MEVLSHSLFLESFILNPLSRKFAGVNEIGFGGAWFRDHVVFPTCRFRQTHEDGFNASTGFQTKHSSSVVDQVEFHIPSPSHELPLLLLFRVLVVLVLFQ